ncbi:PWI domain-containing protein [Paraphysoderma sedebokerense]|nr:PWI domain-containing protein [Paraphysoderma sedebokerense]
MFFKGSSSSQDARYGDKHKKLRKSMNFPPEFNKKVNMKKVQIEVMRGWITKKIVELLGFEDEVLIEMILQYLNEQHPDPKDMQINLTGFLENNTASFVKELWNLLLSAQETVGGIPKEFLEKKKEELLKKRVCHIFLPLYLFPLLPQWTY